MSGSEASAATREEKLTEAPSDVAIPMPAYRKRARSPSADDVPVVVSPSTKKVRAAEEEKRGENEEKEGAAVSSAGTASPDEGTAQPDHGTAPPDEGTTRPDEGTTQPDEGTTQPNGTTHPATAPAKATPPAAAASAPAKPSSGPALGFGAFASRSTPFKPASTPESTTTSTPEPGSWAASDEADAPGAEPVDNVVRMRTVPKPDTAMTTGEEEDRTVHAVRAKLYAMDKDQSWKERGTGVLKINVHATAASPSPRLGTSCLLTQSCAPTRCCV